jgi:hypothetical protein
LVRRHVDFLALENFLAPPGALRKKADERGCGARSIRCRGGAVHPSQIVKQKLGALALATSDSKPWRPMEP